MLSSVNDKYSLDIQFISITIIINPELVAKLAAKIFVALLAERCYKFTGSRVRFEAGSPRVGFWAACQD